MIGTDLYALRACAALGIDVTLVDSFGSLDSACLYGDAAATRTLAVDDCANASHILAALDRAGFEPGDFASAVTTVESAVVATALVGSALHACCIDPLTAVRFRDKTVQKRAVRAAGIATAESITLEDVRSVPDDFNLPWPKGVLKPVAGAAAHSTKVVSSNSELRAALLEFRRTARSRSCLLEQFSPGTEWFLDGVMFHNELTLLSVGTYRRPLIELITAGLPCQVVKYSPDTRPWMYELGEPLARNAARALGLFSGVFHLEAFYDERSGLLKFGEMAARRGGMLIQELVHYESGADLALAAIQAALGIPPDGPDSRRRTVGGTHIPAPPGILLRVPSAREIMNRPGVEYARVEYPPGSRIGVADNTDVKVAQALVTGADDEQIRERTDDMIRWASSQIIVLPDDATARQAWKAAAAIETVPQTAEPPTLYSPDPR